MSRSKGILYMVEETMESEKKRKHHALTSGCEHSWFTIQFLPAPLESVWCTYKALKRHPQQDATGCYVSCLACGRWRLAYEWPPVCANEWGPGCLVIAWKRKNHRRGQCFNMFYIVCKMFQKLRPPGSTAWMFVWFISFASSVARFAWLPRMSPSVAVLTFYKGQLEELMKVATFSKTRLAADVALAVGCVVMHILGCLLGWGCWHPVVWM